jgi:hypothetical protein
MVHMFKPGKLLSAWSPPKNSAPDLKEIEDASRPGPSSSINRFLIESATLARHLRNYSPLLPWAMPTCGGIAQTQDVRWRILVRHSSLLVGAFLIASTGNAALAQSCAENDGQLPVPPAIAERMALPSCGFAATEGGPNACKLCDSRNMHPNPFVQPAIPRSQFGQFR